MISMLASTGRTMKSPQQLTRKLILLLHTVLFPHYLLWNPPILHSTCLTLYLFANLNKVVLMAEVKSS